MRKEAFQLLHDMEDSWWYRARKMVVSRVLDKFLDKKKNVLILDFGAGFGGMFDTLSKYGEVDAFEPNKEARNLCIRSGYQKVFESGTDALSKDNKIHLVALFDVVEHVKDDVNLVSDLYKFLSVGGQVIVTVPAYQWLWGVHDIKHNHYRRYTRESITKLFEKAGFGIEYSSYWNTSLFIPVALTRMLGFSGESSFKMPKLLDSIFYHMVLIESLLIPLTFLPFGTGIVVITKKI